MRRRCHNKENSVWGDNSYKEKYSFTQGKFQKRINCSISYTKYLSDILRNKCLSQEQNLAEEKKKKIKNQLFREQLKVFPSKQCILIWKVVKLSLKCHFNRQMIAPSKLIPKIYCFHTFFLNKGDNLLLPVWKMLLPIIFEYLLDTDSKNIWFYILLY